MARKRVAAQEEKWITEADFPVHGYSFTWSFAYQCSLPPSKRAHKQADGSLTRKRPGGAIVRKRRLQTWRAPAELLKADLDSLETRFSKARLGNGFPTEAKARKTLRVSRATFQALIESGDLTRVKDERLDGSVRLRQTNTFDPEQIKSVQERYRQAAAGGNAFPTVKGVAKQLKCKKASVHDYIRARRLTPIPDERLVVRRRKKGKKPAIVRQLRMVHTFDTAEVKKLRDFLIIERNEAKPALNRDARGRWQRNGKHPSPEVVDRTTPTAPKAGRKGRGGRPPDPRIAKFLRWHDQMKRGQPGLTPDAAVKLHAKTLANDWRPDSTKLRRLLSDRRARAKAKAHAN